MRFAVVGDPVSHSRSPAMHTAAMAHLGIAATYTAIAVPAGNFGSVVDLLRSGELDAVNVTMPHKRAAFEGVDERSDLAIRTGAVNTITTSSGVLRGHNTDVAGVTHAVGTLDADRNAPIVVLGAGGAARAAAVALEHRHLAISARSGASAADLARQLGITADVLPWGQMIPGAVVVNATPIGMCGEVLPDDVIEGASALLDMAYGPTVTPAIQRAMASGTPFADGITMLVGQAAEAFRLFTGVDAPIDVMESAARSA